jgi:acylphosphatase
MKRLRAHVIIDGRVQGVCFRMDTRQEAIRRGLTGWVRNLRDGTVEAVFEGEESDVKGMLKWCERGPSLARVSNVSLIWEAPTGEFDSFRVTYA